MTHAGTGAWRGWGGPPADRTVRLLLDDLGVRTCLGDSAGRAEGSRSTWVPVFKSAGLIWITLGKKSSGPKRALVPKMNVSRRRFIYGATHSGLLPKVCALR